MSLATKLVAVGLELGAIQKDGTNNFHKYNYVTAEAFIAAVRGPLMSHGIAIIPNFRADWKDQPSPKGAPGVACHLHAGYTITDGEESIDAGVVGEGWDSSGDKASYKAMTGAHKYLLRILFNLPMTDDPEADGGNHGTTQQAPQQTYQQGAQPTTPAPQQQPPAPAPEGLRFAMNERPTHKSGNHVFSKGPQREMFDTWTWDDMYRQAVDLIRSGKASPESCALESMVASEFMGGWNKDQADELMKRAEAASQ